MKAPYEPNHHKKRRILPILLLALLCVGSAELIACSIFAPATFDRITAPAKALAGTALDKGRSAASGIAGWYAAVRENADDGTQEAGAPALENTAPILDPAITELVSDGDTAVLTGGILPIVYYDQGSEAWAEQPYGTDQIGRYGCGPAAMAMAVSSMTEETVDPAQMAQAAVSAGHWAKQQGSYLSVVSGLAKAYGLTAQALEPKTVEAMRDALFSGKLLVALMGPGHFTAGGHFILIRGITLQGTFLVADPNSVDRSLQEWDPQLILDELSTSTAHGAPLWTLSAGG